MDAWPSQICPECIGEIAGVVNFCDKIKQTQLTIEARYGKAPEPEDATELTETIIIPSNIEDNAIDVVLEDNEVYQIKYIEEEIEEDSNEGDPSGGERRVMVDIVESVERPSAHKRLKREEPTERSSRLQKRKHSTEDNLSSSESPSKSYSGTEINSALSEFGVLSCKLCPDTLTFKDFRTTKAHNHEEHDLPGVACCTKIYSTRIRLFEHVQFHTTPENNECDVCHKQFKSRTSLKTHKEDHHTDDQINCDSCSFTCKSMKMLRRHELSHIPVDQRSVHCDLCDFKCNFASQLTIHIKSKHSEIKEVHACDTCGKNFSTKGNLMNHFKSFHDPDAVKEVCSTCGKAVRRMSRHKAICQTKLSLKCPECDNVHPNAHALRTHILRMHRRDKNQFKCEICGKVLSRETNLRVSLGRDGELRLRR